jgi:hypothetical protein
MRLFLFRVGWCSYVVKNKKPTAVLAVGLLNFVNVQNPTAALVSSALASSRFRFDLQFTEKKLLASPAYVKCFCIIF